MECCIFSTVPSGAGWICGAGGGHERFLYPMDYVRQMAEKGYIMQSEFKDTQGWQKACSSKTRKTC